MTPAERVIAAAVEFAAFEDRRLTAVRQIEGCEFWDSGDSSIGLAGTPPCHLSNSQKEDYCDQCKAKEPLIEEIRYCKRQRRLILARLARAARRLS